ncbi:hypothetical protein ACFQ0K_01815 [Nocardioides caeni]|uniref:Ig-like domain repeat protein n=1 Tax=Nocardioides caeni TaxID=574700 RepID=UPI0013052EDF|nr:Ig-like domain repeat protein [Nocardioides caeni]
MATQRPTFDGNDYRKRVLAAIHRRGGPENSDPFEIYDLPVDGIEQWSDHDVAEQVGEVWGFWQRQRDHPKYGTLASQLVEGHADRSSEVLDRQRRESLAAWVRSQRDARDADRYGLLDEAISRLVQRHGGIPRDKIPGLVEIGVLGGLTEDEVQVRLRRHRFVDVAAAPVPAAPRPGPVSDLRRQQVRDLLDEFGRLQECPPPPTLLALLGLDPHADEAEIAMRAEVWRARARELPPLRLRVVVDELMVHAADLLESGPIVRDAYLDAVVADVRDRLRPKMRAAVLVEDRLLAEDHDHLVEEAIDLGLDLDRARGAVTALAAELDVPVEAGHTVPAPTRHTEPDRAWEQALRAARAALRGGALIEARRLVAVARSSADSSAGTPIRAVADEVEEALREAELRWRAAATALGARRFSEALDHLDHLHRTANDVPGPAGVGALSAEMTRARDEIAEADRHVEQARAGDDPVTALLAVIERWPAHPSALAALATHPLHPPARVRAARDASGAVVVEWDPSATRGASYKVSRVAPDGSLRVVGRTGAVRIEDGGAAGGPVPDYVVVAVQPGRTSEEARSSALAPTAPAAPPTVPVPAAAPVPAAEPVAPLTPATDVTAVRQPDGGVLVRWSGPDGAQFKVSRLTGDGRAQVVGRTGMLSIEDGGAPADAVPVYVVETNRGGQFAPEARSAPVG